MTKIEKKAWPELFEKVLCGEKNFDVRLNNFKCKPGDILVLREWDPKIKKYTGRILEKKISFVITTKQLSKFWTKEEIQKYGFQVIGF
ncbi:hypothetical protein A2159_00095 [Candidatus Woesebacteria bacterium RBG_13_34_9]|uniref:DUF3850 domain-containing protein n=1 Tax=Candidatus Woesebacteria bacterium RBG_13_34_9 TaxID=1802477 RepID=A0A1F7X4A4_9BACT|nr:MAG: hypothetical protein A2159_00095 [Candidatus Woesebacteria bacterium RBG_13_34_9]